MLHIPAHKANAGQIVNKPEQTLRDYVSRKQEAYVPTNQNIDTQLIRNKYMSRPEEQLDRFFGDFACEFLGVSDNWLRMLCNVNEACNYIISKGYNIKKE